MGKTGVSTRKILRHSLLISRTSLRHFRRTLVRDGVRGMTRRNYRKNVEVTLA